MVIFSTITYAQKPINSIGLSAYYGYIFVHSPQVQKTEGARPRGVSVDWIWQLIDEKTWNTCNCYPRMGLSVSYFNFDNEYLGYGITPSYFIEPSFRIYKQLQFALRGSLGLSYLSNPYDPVTNPNNQSYSLPITGFLGISGGINLKITSRLNFSTAANFYHLSNGGISDPNKGIDWPTIRVGLDYALTNTEIPRREKIKKDYSKIPIRKEVYALLSGRNAANGEKTKYLIYGIGAGISKQVSGINALVAGIEWHHDLAAEEILKQQSKLAYDGRFGGLLGGNEFILGQFLFSQQLGYYWYTNNPDYPSFYQRYGLIYRTNNHLGLGINFKAHAEHAHFLDARVVWSF